MLLLNCHGLNLHSVTGFNPHRITHPPGRPLHQQRTRRIHICCASTQESPSENIEEGWLWSIGNKTKAASASVAELRRENVQAKKSLGQNFLTDDKILANIVYAAGIQPNDVVLEVGPGTGNLTRHLIKTGATIVAVEKDDYLITKLEAEFKDVKNIRLVHGDITRLDLGRIMEEGGEARGSYSSSPPTPPPRKFKVVANLPYNITKDFLTLMLPKSDLVSELSIMIQEEVAQRLVTKKTGGKDYRAMSVFTHFYSQPKYRFRIPRAKYYPVPGVDGALVTFKLRPGAQRVDVPDDQGYLRLVKCAFNQRRKQLRNSLQSMHPGEQVESALGSLGLNVEARAQDLSVEQFAALAWELKKGAEEAAAADGGDGGGGDEDNLVDMGDL